MTFRVRYYHSDMRGAPVLQGVAGTALTVIDACARTGFGEVMALGIVVSGGIATATFNGGESFSLDATIRIAGVTNLTALNGDHTVLSTPTSTTVTFATTAPDGTATGTIMVKVAPFGWTREFTGTNLAAYKASAVEASGCLARFNDTDTLALRVRGYESMTDIGTGVNPFPTDAQRSGGQFWPKSNLANTNPIPWEVVADDLGFHFITAMYVGSNAANAGRAGAWAGDVDSWIVGDAFGFLVSTLSAAAVGACGTHYSNYGGQANYENYMARAAAQRGSSFAVNHFSSCFFVQASSVSGVNSGRGGTYGAGKRLMLTEVLVGDGNAAGVDLRGALPGIYHTPQLIPAGTFAPRDIVIGTGALAGRRLLCAPGNGNNGPLSGQTGCTFYDLTGPWRKNG